MCTIAAEKAAARRAARAGEESLTPREKQESDRMLCERFLALPQVERAGTVLLYAGMAGEISVAAATEALLRRGKRVCLPRCLAGHAMEARAIGADTALVRHPWGMLEPGEECPQVERSQVEIILAPGMCFDRERYRLGRGGGYYDRYLAGYGGFTVGLCRDRLLARRLPREEHDRPVSLVLSETERF